MKNKKSIIVEKIWEPVYRFDTIFLIGMKWKDAKKELKKWSLENIEVEFKCATGGLCTLNQEDFPKQVKSGEVYILWIESIRDFYTMVHEVSHLVIRVFENKGITIDESGTEAFAFYHEFWIKKLWKMMSKK